MANSVDVDLVRGSLSWKRANEDGTKCFHTTHFKEIIERENFVVPRKLRASKKIKKMYRIAETGDILFARVGRNLVDQVVWVKSGEMAITDCIYRMRVPVSSQRKIWKFANSIKGKEWLAARTRGVCAKYISRKDLLAIPIVI